MKKEPEMPIWLPAAVLSVLAGGVGTVAYYDVEVRYAFLAIGMLGGSAILGTCILGSTVALIRYLRTRNVVTPHKFETKPPKPESWK